MIFIPTKINNMKRVSLAIIIALGTLTISNAKSACVEAPLNVKVVTQDDFEEVEISNLPEAIKEVIAKDLKGVEVTKAYVNDKGEYKLIVTSDDNTTKTLYANKNGEWIKKQ